MWIIAFNRLPPSSRRCRPKESGEGGRVVDPAAGNQERAARDLRNWGEIEDGGRASSQFGGSTAHQIAVGQSRRGDDAEILQEWVVGQVLALAGWVVVDEQAAAGVAVGGSPVGGAPA